MRNVAKARSGVGLVRGAKDQVGDIRMLVDEGGSVVDFVVDYDVEILYAKLGQTSAIECSFSRFLLIPCDKPSSSYAPRHRSM